MYTGVIRPTCHLGQQKEAVGAAGAIPCESDMAALFQALLPAMAFLVAHHLGESWCILFCYQTLQGLCCECRKWRNNDPDVESGKRRPGWDN